PRPPRLAAARAVKRHPPVLLPHEMKRGEIRDAAPEEHRAGVIQRDADDERRDRRERTQHRPPPQFRAVEIRTKKRRTDVRDIDEENREEPRPRRSVAAQDAEPRANRERDEREQCAAAENGYVEVSREEPRRFAPFEREGELPHNNECAL